MTKYTAVLPYCYEPFKDEFMKTCKLQNLLLINNTVTNLGIMRSHNMGIDQMRKDGSDWLIVISAAIRFGKNGGLDLIDKLEELKDHLIVEVADVFGWHCIAFRKELFDIIGRWDENFSPYGWDDLDISWRIQKAVPDYSKKWIKVLIDVKDTVMAHGINLGGVRGDPNALMRYYKHKWGGLTGHEIYQNPYNELKNPVSYWEPAPNGGFYNEVIIR